MSPVVAALLSGTAAGTVFWTAGPAWRRRGSISALRGAALRAVRLVARPRPRAARDGLPGLLLDLADGVRAGLDLPMALRTVRRSGEVGRRVEAALAAYDLGAPFVEALDPVLGPEGSDGRTVRRVLDVFFEAGGEAAPMLATLADSIERRRLWREEALAKSVEGRLSAWALALLPLVVAVVVAVWFPAMLAPLLDTATGRWAAAYGAASWLAGTALSVHAVRSAVREGQGSSR